MCEDEYIVDYSTQRTSDFQLTRRPLRNMTLMISCLSLSLTALCTRAAFLLAQSTAENLIVEGDTPWINDPDADAKYKRVFLHEPISE